MKPLDPERAGTSGSLGSMVRRDQGSPARPPGGPVAAAPPQPSRSPFPAQQANEGVDLSNPMQRRRTHRPARPPPQRPGPSLLHPSARRGEVPPPGKHGGRRPELLGRFERKSGKNRVYGREKFRTSRALRSCVDFRAPKSVPYAVMGGSVLRNCGRSAASLLVVCTLLLSACSSKTATGTSTPSGGSSAGKTLALGLCCR